MVSYNNDLKSNKILGQTLQQMSNEGVQVNEGKGLCVLSSLPLLAAFRCNINRRTIPGIRRELPVPAEGRGDVLTATGR